MELHSLIALTRILAKFKFLADGLQPTKDSFQIVLAASRVLSDWPANFFGLLSDLGSRPGVVNHGAVGKQFEGIYGSLMKNEAISKVEIEFMRAAFMEFVSEHWGRGFVDPKLISGSVSVRPARFVSLAEFSARIRVQPRTAQRILKDHPATAERVACGNAFRTIVDANSEFIPPKAPGCVLRLRVAARVLGLPVSTLQELKASGVFEVKHLPPGHPGWHERDLDAFAGRLATVASSTPTGLTCETLSIGQVMNNRHLPPTVKARFLSEILSGNIPTAGAGKPQVAAQRISTHRYVQFVSEFNGRLTGSVSTVEAARELECDPGSLPGLVERGHVRGTRTPRGLRIATDSITQFRSEYAVLVSHAKQIGTSTRALMQTCEKNGLNLLIIPVRGRTTVQAFIRVADLAKLCRLTA
jgi:hypothetical protein